MPTRTGTSYGTDTEEPPETNWAAEAAAAAVVADAAPHFDSGEEEEWVDTGADDDGEGDAIEDLAMGHESTVDNQRPTWVLNVEIPNSDTHGTCGGFGSANIFIDSGMTSERLGQCIIQAVNINNYSTINSRDGLVGLFGKEDHVFYSLEFILGMNPADGARRIFCVTKPARPNAKITKGADGDSQSIFSYVPISTLLPLFVVLFPGIFIAVTAADRIHFIYSFLSFIPQDLPSMWGSISYLLDWPARELYRYGPSVVGWEGRELIDICAQMNRRYYTIGIGRDSHNYEEREYWRQNPEACETIYRLKEESFARMCRPVWYIMTLIAIFMVFQRLLNNFLAKDPGPQLNRIDRAVLDTYQALRMLAREHQFQEDRRQNAMVR